MNAVLDASALLAYLHGERGANEVDTLVATAIISAVNWSEVLQRLLAHGVESDSLRTDVEALGVEIVPFAVEDADRAAALWATTRQAGLSLGDRACLALAGRLGCPAVTADRAWADIDIGVEVRAIR